MFALHNGGECRSGHSSGNVFKLHGKSRGCHKGIGNHMSNHVYHVKKDGKNRHGNFILIIMTFDRYEIIFKQSY